MTPQLAAQPLAPWPAFRRWLFLRPSHWPHRPQTTWRTSWGRGDTFFGNPTPMSVRQSAERRHKCLIGLGQVSRTSIQTEG
jgi:hypothetical protein